MVTCADTSFLFSLYGNDRNTSRAVRWMKVFRSVLSVTPLNEYELGNALRFAEFRKVIMPGDAGIFWSQFEIDRVCGRVNLHNCNLSDIVDESKRLSAAHTLTGGHRGFDILHVAAAIQLHATHFLTFDGNQKKLPESEGLVVPV